jgi:CheY-like chemotaxis protein
VALNLLTNAAEAIGDGIGTVRLSAQLEPRAAMDATAGPAAWVRITVADDGEGMPPEVQRRIFEPFYTTKRSGRGLGLSAVIGIIRSSGGTLELDSAPGQGSRFEIRLPAATPPSARPPERTSGQHTAARPTVLVIDDEDALRRVCRRALESRGFGVLEAEDGARGLAAFEAGRASIGLVILDLTMPGLGGMEVLARLRELEPRLPVIIASGYAEEGAPAITTDAQVRYLQKPFGVKMLQRLVDELLP